MQYNSTFATKIKLNRQNSVANVLFYLKNKEKAPFGEMRTELLGMIPLRSFLQKRQYETVKRQSSVANDNFSYILSLECDIYTDNSLRKRSVPIHRRGLHRGDVLRGRDGAGPRRVPCGVGKMLNLFLFFRLIYYGHGDIIEGSLYRFNYGNHNLPHFR